MTKQGPSITVTHVAVADAACACHAAGREERLTREPMPQQRFDKPEPACHESAGD